MIKLLKRLLVQIESKQKKRIRVVIFLMVMSSVVEVLSIGSVIPFISVLTNPEIVFYHEYAQKFIIFAGIKQPNQLLLPFTIAFSFAALVSGVMRITLLWRQTHLAHSIGVDLGYKTYKKTLFQPYFVHIERNSSELISSITVKINQVISGIVMPFLTIISSFIMVLFIAIALVAINPIAILSAIIIFVSTYSLFIIFTKQKLISNSEKISKKTDLTFKELQEGLGGFRDILLDGTQLIHCKVFASADTSRRHAMAMNQIIGQSPRYGIETLSMIMIASAAYYFESSQENMINTLPLLGALAIGAQRMLPMLQQSYAAWTNIQGSKKILQDSLELLEQPLPDYINHLDNPTIKFQKSIKLQQLWFGYQGCKKHMLNNINIEITKGSRVGFIGKTGSGKSTLIDIIMALLSPSEGRVKIDGVEINNKNYRSWQSCISHVPQSIYLSDATIAENIAFGLSKESIDYERVIEAAQRAQIDGTIKTWDNQYDTMVGERGIRLSGGQRQRIGIARALYKNSKVLIFDEATSALDDSTENEVMKAIDCIHKDITILMVAHRLSTLINCDLIIELENGSVKRQGTPEEIINYSGR